MKKTLWNENWSFWKDGKETEKKAVTLPHDAMLLEERIPNLKGGTATGFYPGGKYYYEKTFTADEELVNGTVILEFGGVYQKSSVFLNGTRVGGHIYGYSDYLVDLSGKLQHGENTLLVEADNNQYGNARWYTGSGIYKDVWLYTAGKNYIKPFGVKVTTESIAPANISVTVDAVLEDGMTVLVEVYKDGEMVASEKGAACMLEIPDAKLWTAETPDLYDLSVTLKDGRKVIDKAIERFGIRTLAWNAKEGFLVNGTSVKLRGGCVHEDNGPLGAASFKKAEVRRMKKMKESGYNAVRYAHQPAGSAFLEACDEVGLYVMDETFDTWFNVKSTYDYGLYFEDEWEKDIVSMIRVAHNHPSVIMYSIGNEIGLKDVEKTTEYTRKMVACIRELDKSRAVTNSLNPAMTVLDVGSALGADKDKDPRNDPGDPAPTEKADKAKGSLLVNLLITALPKILKIAGSEKKMKKIDPVMSPLDIVGLNYGTHLYLDQHKDFPDRVLVGSETLPSKLPENWKLVEQCPHLIGDFKWTAWDYLGEAGVGLPKYDQGESFNAPYPCVTAGCGSIDLTGFIDSQGWYSAVIWGQRETPYIAVHPVDHFGEKVAMGRWRATDAVHSWSWKGCEGGKAAVDVYSNAKYVELFQDGVSLGKQEVQDWKASYELTCRPGKLEAVSYDMAHRLLGRDVLFSAETETVLTVEPEDMVLKADPQDISFVNLSLTDRSGIVKMLEDRDLTVSVEGPAELISVCSGNPEQIEELVSDTCQTYHGRAVAVLRPTGKTGEVIVTVEVPGLEAVTVNLKAE